jgi:hypothetical protein
LVNLDYILAGDRNGVRVAAAGVIDLSKWRATAETNPAKLLLQEIFRSIKAKIPRVSQNDSMQGSTQGIFSGMFGTCRDDSPK